MFINAVLYLYHMSQNDEVQCIIKFDILLIFVIREAVIVDLSPAI